MCERGLVERYGAERAASDAALRERLEYELGVDHRDGLRSYFLIVWDFIKYARDRDIPVGPGRGSAVGSLVSYLPAHHRPRSDQVQADLRALPQSRPHLDARHRHGLLRRAARRSDRVRHRKVRLGPGRADRHLRDDGGARRGARRGPRAGRAAARRRPGREADPVGPGRALDRAGAQADPGAAKRSTTAAPQIRKLLDTAKSIEGLGAARLDPRRRAS